MGQVFIPVSFMRSVKNEGLIPESFVKMSSSSLDFHKNTGFNLSITKRIF